MNRLVGLIPMAIAAALCVSLAPSCTSHGEGGRCDPNNSNADCDNGLVCIQAQDIILPEGGYSQAAICCPVDRAALMPGDICYLNSNTPGSDAGIPEGGFPEASSDAPVESSSDAPIDQSSDAIEEGDVSTDGSGE